jgi:signal transduction histidine kinase
MSDRIIAMKNFATTMPPITCDEQQMITLFVNIFENACDAIENKGTIRIRTSLIEQLENQKMRRKVEIMVEDSGKGMSESELTQLYVPFQSTKSGGTGIGLIIAREIIRRHNGTINIASRKDIGTVVTIHLPVTVFKIEENIER